MTTITYMNGNKEVINYRDDNLKWDTHYYSYKGLPLQALEIIW